MGVSCKNCGGTELDNDPARGDAVCVSCGSVVESLCMVSSVEFQENSAGNASVIGQFVSAEGMQHSVGAGYKYGVGGDHRQAILDRGRKMINQMGGTLKMSHHCLDSAFMFYKMACSKRFTSGRKTTHVIGACLYLVSRTEKTPHMLLDVCDVVGCDVVSLGRVFLQLARELCIDCPIIDPSLYIHRFAHQLDFGDKENEVSMTALRIMGRMKKDWIHLGRRPSALCGAALIIAGKLFNFNVTMDDIVKLVRMSKTTVFKRLMDFSKTASGKLTTDEFKTVDLEEEADPPCYTEGRNRAKFAQETCNKYDFVSSDILSQVVKTQEKLELLLEKRKNIRHGLEKQKKLSDAFDYRRYLPLDYSLYSYELDEKGQFKNADFVIHKDKEEQEAESSDKKDVKSTASSTLLLDTSIKKCEDDVEVSSDQPSAEAEAEAAQCEIDTEDIDDAEIEQLLLTEEEIRIKTEVWLEENKEYLLKLKEKEEEQRLKELEEAKYGIKKKKRTYTRRQKDRPVCETADEAIKTMLVERKLSSKINYDVLRGLKSEGKTDGDIKKEAVDIKKEAFSKNLMEKSKSDEPEIVYENSTLPKQNTNKRAAPILFPSIGAEAPKKIKVEDSSQSEKKSSPLAKEPVIESGPLTNEIIEEEDMLELDDEDDDNNVTASSLFARKIDEYDDYEEYNDDNDDFY